MDARSAQIRPGSTAFAAAPDGIRRVTYQTSALKLSAQRADGKDAFAIRTEYSDGRPPQQCSTSANLAGILPKLVEITAKRELTQRQVEADFPVMVGTLMLEDQIANEPIAPFDVHMRLDRSAVALVYSGTAIEANIRPEVFDRLAAGCAGLGVR
jgi:hypothetical protein